MTNTVENYFSVFKRGVKGTYRHCGKKHLHRYLAEFDFRYSNRSANGCEDVERAERALKGIVGKRLTYRLALTAGEKPIPNGRHRRRHRAQSLSDSPH
ncbi:hypothetical protein BH09PSE1_BH09PSE1_11660 [soil metagenome]